MKTSENARVVRAVLAHHAALSEQLDGRTEAVLDAARRGGGRPERDALCEWYRTALIPHAVAEEGVLYAAGRRLAQTRLLVDGMAQEHLALVALVARLGVVASAVDIAAAVSAAREVFAVHLTKSNDLLLPALGAAGLDLGELLAGLHEIVEQPAEGTGDATGGGATAVPETIVCTSGL